MTCVSLNWTNMIEVHIWFYQDIISFIAKYFNSKVIYIWDCMSWNIMEYLLRLVTSAYSPTVDMVSIRSPNHSHFSSSLPYSFRQYKPAGQPGCCAHGWLVIMMKMSRVMIMGIRSKTELMSLFTFWNMDYQSFTKSGNY